MISTHHNLGDQLVVRVSKPMRTNFEKIRNDTGLGVKPRGGLWTSTFTEENGSDWVKWCLDEDYFVPRDYQWHAWRVVPLLSAMVLEIDSYEDLRQIIEDWGFGIRRPNTWPDDLTGTSLNFEALAKEVDAIHLTDAGQWATRLSLPYSLYGWDCESTLWLNWGIYTVQDLGIRTWGRPEPTTPEPGTIRRARRDL